MKIKSSSTSKIALEKSLLVVLIISLFASCTPNQENAQKSDYPSDGSVLPFPEPPSASVAGKTLKDSKHQWRKAENHLPADAPNIVIFMTDDAGFSNPSTFGGPINTPTMTRLAESGISYNAFHTTAMCSPTRASLLTGRNHHRVGAGQIAELASDWDGYVGLIPKSTATFAQVLSYYGYNTAAFGKWHNTPVTDITKLGPFDRYPTGLGFDYFYGFLAGETSQYEPALFENTNPVQAPHDPRYHLTEDMTEKAIEWLRTSNTINPGKPIFLYFTPGNVDTYYSTVFFDLSEEAFVLSVPATERYYLLPMLDAYTNVFESPGTRTTGTDAQDFLITGPFWEGEIPVGEKI